MTGTRKNKQNHLSSWAISAHDDFPLKRALPSPWTGFHDHFCIGHGIATELGTSTSIRVKKFTDRTRKLRPWKSSTNFQPDTSVGVDSLGGRWISRKPHALVK
jgi:hypothetical protein